jgi:hypothetical protein
METLRELWGDAPPLPEAMAERFRSYHEIKDWLTEQGLPFEAAFDGRA